MRNLFIVTLLFMSCNIFADGNTAAEKAKQIIFGEDRLSTSFKQHGMTPIVFEQLIGARVTKKMSVLFSYSAMVGLYHREGMKTYYSNPLALGGGLDYCLLRQNKDNGFFAKGMSLDGRILITSTVCGSNVKYTSFEAGIYHYNSSKEIAPTLGIGFRHMNYHTAGIKNSYGVFVSVGFKY